MQLTYRANPDIAFPGMLADTAFKRTVSRPVGSTLAILPGVFVSEDVNGLVQGFGTASCIYSGVAQHDHTLNGSMREDGTYRSTAQWETKDTMSVLQKGPIWVLVATGSTLARNQPVSALPTAGAQLGFATHAAAANAVAIPNAIATSNVFTMVDGRRIIQVELAAGNV